jgi:hypothetical protein
MTTQIVAQVKLDPCWDRVPGVSTSSTSVNIDLDKYFFRYEESSWRIVDWSKVQEAWASLSETDECTLDQQCLNFVQRESRETKDGAEVLKNAAEVYNFIFDENRIDLSVIPFAKPEHLQILREMSIMMALNRVSKNGIIKNIGPAWFFADCAQQVYGLSDQTACELDDLYHGSFFNEWRRIDATKAHTALGGRLIHCCGTSTSGGGHGGGVVVEYGTSSDNFHRDFKAHKQQWIAEIRNWSIHK